METLKTILDFILQSILAEVVVVAAGVLFAQFILDRWEQWRYGSWRVIIYRGGEEVLNRVISHQKARNILSEPADLSVFLKGVASPYAWIKCDLIEQGNESGLLVEDRKNRCFVINLDKNPTNKDSTKVQETAAMQTQ